MARISTSILIFFIFFSCAQLHHAQIGEIDSTRGKLEPFEIKISELGLSTKEAADITKALVSDSTKKDVDTVSDILELFQVGPRTGNPVFNDTFADEMATEILIKCPSGKVTGLTSIRETRKYPVISGEIVKIKGYCIL